MGRLSPIIVQQSIAASPEDVWAVLSAPGHLTECHPFCARNPVHSWPGVGSGDTIEYYNGRVVERRFTAWRPGSGYDLEVHDANGPLAEVAWRITEGSSGSQLQIALTPRMLEGLPAGIRSVAWLVAVRPMMRRYLRSVVRGVEWRVTTGEPVRRNQFGSHRWFSRRAAEGARR